jgi:hypothetical protein
MVPRAKYQATEEKVTDAFKNLNLDTFRKEKNILSLKDYEKQFNLSIDEDGDDDCTGILLSNELKETLKESKKNSDFEMLKKIHGSSNKE